MKQLYKYSPKDFSLVSFYAGEGIKNTRSAGTMPQFMWPDGRWCIDVMFYMHELLARGYEHEPKGGTLGTYCAYLTPLVKLCYENFSKNFLRITDKQFSITIRSLYEATRNGCNNTKIPRYNRTTIRHMVHVWLDFLSFLSDFYAVPFFIGKDGQIKAEKIQTKINIPGNKTSLRWTWSHPSLGPSDPYHRRTPLRDSQLKALREAARRSSASQFIKRRRLVMLELFDTIGLRRIEAHLLRVSDVENAIIKYKAPVDYSDENINHDEFRRNASFLSFRMRKQSDKSKDRLREVPISSITLHYFKEYLIQRRIELKKNGITENGNNQPFFINIKNNSSFTPNFFTQEFNLLARVAGINEPCSPHMARSRYITREFVRLINAHQLENKDDFRRALINSNIFIEQIKEITGHKSSESLKVYIDLAFSEVAHFSKTLSRVEAQRNIDAIKTANQRYKDSIESGEDPEIAISELSRVLSSL